MAEPPADDGSDANIPRWVKVCGLVGGALVLLVIILMMFGHGPWRHWSENDWSPVRVALGPTGFPTVLRL